MIEHLTDDHQSECCSADCQPRTRLYPELEEAARLFRVLADETRLAILRQLAGRGAVCAGDFQACCAVAQPTVSHHLRVLREAGLITAEKRGLQVVYSLNRDKLSYVQGLLSWSL